MSEDCPCKIKYSCKMNNLDVRDRMQRARTPFGAVPISTIYGYDYPLRDYSSSSTRNEASSISESADYMVRTSRAMTESRTLDPYYLRSNAETRSFLPSALQEAHRMSRESTPVHYRDGSPIRATSPFRYGSIPPVLPSSAADSDYRTISYSGTSPWNSTGFAYTPRYPQSYRGTASTSVPYARRYSYDDMYLLDPPYHKYVPFYMYYRNVTNKLGSLRYPARRFVPSYVPIRYSRRY